MRSRPALSGKSEQVALRLDPDLLARIEAYRARLGAETGLEVTTAAAMRRLIERGLGAKRTKVG